MLRLGPWTPNVGDNRNVDIVVRPPEPGDVDELARINIAAWRWAYSGLVPQSRLDEMAPAVYRERWRRTAAGDHPPGVRYLVGLLGGAPTSYVIFGPYRTQEDAEPGEDTSGWGEIYAIYTDPDRQGLGAGTAVHDAALAELGRSGVAAAALWVLAGNERARAWYARRGWAPDGCTSEWDAHGTRLPELRLRHLVP